MKDILEHYLVASTLLISKLKKQQWYLDDQDV